LPELTEQKFVNNWLTAINPTADPKSSAAPWGSYYLGPRDRLYRTGDLGRYLPNGDGNIILGIPPLTDIVECAGRADDQVKIRGFRIELGEIDTYLTQHPLVRENITLVRRDKDEEPTLVSYIVPQQSKELVDLISEEDDLQDLPNDDLVKGLRKYRGLIREIRNHLKSKLPSYAVPTGFLPFPKSISNFAAVFVPLSKMPLNPNGKVDKPALPFPDTAQLAAASRSHKDHIANGITLTATQRTVREIWLSVIPHAPQDIRTNDNFFDVGGHSILATRVVFEIRRRFAIDLPLGILFRQPTIFGLSEEIDNLRGGSLDIVPRPSPGDLDGASEYSEDAIELTREMPVSYPKAGPTSKGDAITVFLTGATGFLGAYLIRDLLSRSGSSIRIIAHVRAKSQEDGITRIRNNCGAYGVWREEWVRQIEVVTGSLESELLGISSQEWNRLGRTVDVVIHNGAMVCPEHFL
jgi:L-2-aminoadipate reductase